MPSRAAVYVDGFNLYYRALKKRPACKWLDLQALAQRLLGPKDVLVSIKYFTARVHPRPPDNGQRQRQDFYLRALRTNPLISIIEGHFLVNETRMMLAPSEQLRDLAGNPVDRARVVKTEEKGSDVNLASHLLVDGFEDAYDLAVLVSADTDLVEPFRLARVALKKRVALFTPAEHAHPLLKQHAHFKRLITEADLLACQLPNQITDAMGTFHRPPTWC